jgi:mono/diheme cytochrome c family protein
MRLPSRMRVESFLLSRICVLLALGVAGCNGVHGRPGPGPEVARPEEVLAFPVLYKLNCAGCHGENGRHGAAISLANPMYIAVAGESHIHDAIAIGVRGKLMPGFGKIAGGLLTDQQVTALTQGIVQQWGTPNLLAGQSLPPYLTTLQGNAEHGQEAYGVFCARCHGVNGEGKPTSGQSGMGKLGSIVNPSYLALISDQNLRSIIIAGRPDEGMPDWRSDAGQPLTDQQITDILVWLATKRVANPGQPYPIHP